ncbi:hypothetical protein Bca4012_044039 [Brassica carinata]
MASPATSTRCSPWRSLPQICSQAQPASVVCVGSFPSTSLCHVSAVATSPLCESAASLLSTAAKLSPCCQPVVLQVLSDAVLHHEISGPSRLSSAKLEPSRKSTSSFLASPVTSTHGSPKSSLPRIRGEAQPASVVRVGSFPSSSLCHVSTVATNLLCESAASVHSTASKLSPCCQPVVLQVLSDAVLHHEISGPSRLSSAKLEPSRKSTSYLS